MTTLVLSIFYFYFYFCVPSWSSSILSVEEYIEANVELLTIRFTSTIIATNCSGSDERRQEPEIPFPYGNPKANALPIYINGHKRAAEAAEAAEWRSRERVARDGTI